MTNSHLVLHNWTKTHGFFALMGGFMRHNDADPPTVMEAENVPDVVKNRILEADIQDRSKGDGLSKTLALVQTTWFILQCFSRVIEGIAVTELEVATCAFAALNLVTYILWWNKPLNVGCALLVYGDGDTEGPAMDEGQGRGWWQSLKKVREAFIQGLVDIPEEFYRPIDGFKREVGITIAKSWMRPLAFMEGIVDPIMEGTSYANESHEGEKLRVGTFGPKPASPDYCSYGASTVIGIIYGGIHCAAWGFQFPSPVEQNFWRGSAVAVTVLPLLMGLTAILPQPYCIFVFGLLMIPYFIARLALIVLSFTTLRSPPPSVFRTADWTRHIPHFA
jgi:hypothetical protein